MSNTTTTPAWMNLNGMITCRKHAPMSLTAILEDTPNAREIRTRYDLWQRLTQTEIKALTAHFATIYGKDTPHICETCRYQQ